MHIMRELVATSNAIGWHMVWDYAPYLWDELNEKMYEYLEKISLRDLLHKKQLVEKVQKRTVYATSPIGRAMNLVA